MCESHKRTCTEMDRSRVREFFFFFFGYNALVFFFCRGGRLGRKAFGEAFMYVFLRVCVPPTLGST